MEGRRGRGRSNDPGEGRGGRERVTGESGGKVGRGVEMEEVERPGRGGERLDNRKGDGRVAAEDERDGALGGRLGDGGGGHPVVAVPLPPRPAAAIAPAGGD